MLSSPKRGRKGVPNRSRYRCTMLQASCEYRLWTYPFLHSHILLQRDFSGSTCREEKERTDQRALASSRKSPIFYWWKILATICHLPSILTSEWKSVNPRPCQSSRTTRTVAAVPTTSIISTSYFVSGAAPS